MSSPPGRRSRRLLVAVAFIAGILATAAVAYWLYGDAGRWTLPWFAGSDDQDGRPGQSRPHLDGDAPAMTQPGTVLIFDRRYESCAHVVTDSEPAGERLAGLTAAELEQALAGWRVVEFSAETVRLQQDFPGDCPSPDALYTLGIHQGQVVIFAGRGLSGPPHAETDIEEADLLPGDRALLENGVTVEGIDKAWQFLEGITDHQGS